VAATVRAAVARLDVADQPLPTVGDQTGVAVERWQQVARGQTEPRAAEVAGWPDAPSQAETAAMLEPVGRNFIPDRYR
jgi:hypothetical protein